LVKKKERRPGEVLGAPFERRHLGADAREVRFRRSSP
jgi:hypothetical protein